MSGIGDSGKMMSETRGKLGMGVVSKQVLQGGSDCVQCS